MRGDHQWFLRSFLGDVIARGVRKLVQSQLLTDNVRCQEQLQPVARSGRPVVGSYAASANTIAQPAEAASARGWGEGLPGTAFALT